MNPEEMAQRFHEAYERLAPSFGYETRRESAVPWAEVPESNRRLMAATVAEAVGPLLAEVERLRGENAAYREVWRVLRDQSVIIAEDGAVFERIAKWTNAPSNTASAALEGKDGD